MIAKSILFTVLGLATALAGTTNSAPGIAGSATLNGINTVTDIVVPYVFNYLDNIKIPDMSFSGGSMTNIVFKIN